jgi:hypothetical protein
LTQGQGSDQNNNDGVQIDANIGASCIIFLKLAGNHYKFKEASPSSKKESMDSFDLLMQAQETCCVFPEHYGNPSNFWMKIYTFIIDDLVKGDFSVQFDAKIIRDKVANLFRAIQDTLVMLKSRVVKSKLPQCFQHNIRQFRCRDCTTTTHAIKVKDTFIISVGECKLILQTKWWSLEKLCPSCLGRPSFQSQSQSR